MVNYEEIDIKRVLEIISNKKIFIVLILIISIALGCIYSYYYKVPEYKSSVTILLVADETKNEKQVTQTDVTLNSELITTYSSIIKSSNILNKTIENLGLDISAKKLNKNVEAVQVDKTQFLKVSVKNENPEIAKNIANEIAKVFTQEIKEIYNIANINIVDEAEIATQPCNINHSKDLVVFSFVGIALSAMLILGVYFFEDTINDELDIEKNINIQCLGTVPMDKEKQKLIIETNPKSQIVECIKTLRTNILYATNRNAILITSGKPGEGKSWITNNLAITFAKINKKTIIVNTDLRSESELNNIFNISKDNGLSDYIKEITEDQIENLEKIKKYIKETEISNLHILSNGTIPPNPSELISSSNMRKIIEILKNMYDVVLLDGTACNIFSDSIALSSMVDTTIVVVENGKTKINDLKRTVKSIKDVKGLISGVIINKTNQKKGKYYGKSYGYYSSKDDMEKNEQIDNNKKIDIDEIIEMAKIKILEQSQEGKLNCVDDINDFKVDENKENNETILNFKFDVLNELAKLKNIFIETNKNDKKNNKKLYENMQLYFEDFVNKFQGINNEILNIHQIQTEYNKKIEILNNIIKEMDYNKQLEQLNSKIEGINYDEKLEQLNSKIEGINYDEKLEQLNSKIEGINYDEKLEQLNSKIEGINYDEQLEQLNSKIEGINYDEQLEQLNSRIEGINYDEQIEQLNNKIDEIKNKHKEENIQDKVKNEDKSFNNIISFEKFTEKRRKAKRTYTLEEDITFEDLEKNSTCIIEISKNEKSDIAISN